MIKFHAPAQVIKVLTLTAFLLASIQTASAAEEWKDCELFNFTDRVVTQVYMCAADVDINKYGKNMLEGRSPLKNGDGIAVQYPAEHRYYNFRIVFDNGDFVDWQNLDCADMHRLILFNDGADYKVRTD